MQIKEQVIAGLTKKLSSCVGEKESNGSNRSTLIDKINSFVKAQLGSPYCLSGIIYHIEQYAIENSLDFDLPVTPHCRTFWNTVRSDLKCKSPSIGDIVIWGFKGTSMGHAGYVVGVLPGGKMETIEFNTRAETAIVREGDGVYRRVRSQSGSLTMQVLGFVRISDSIVS